MTTEADRKCYWCDKKIFQSRGTWYHKRGGGELGCRPRGYKTAVPYDIEFGIVPAHAGKVKKRLDDQALKV